MSDNRPGFNELRPPAAAMILAAMTGNQWAQQRIIRRYAADERGALELLLTVAQMAGALAIYAAGMDENQALILARMTLADATERRAAEVTPA